jgi:hypothetical protein
VLQWGGRIAGGGAAPKQLRALVDELMDELVDELMQALWMLANFKMCDHCMLHE